MRAYRWLFITGAIAAVLLILAIAAGSVWLNSYLHSEAFRQEVQTRAGQSLGGPVQIEQIDFSIFRGVQLKGLATQLDANHSGGQGAVVAKIESVNCTYALGDLLFGRLKLTGLTLDKPNIVLTRQPAATLQPIPPSNGAETGEAASESTTPRFQFILEKAKVSDGGVSIRDASGAPLAELSGIGLSLDTGPYYDGREITGNVRIANVGLPSNLNLTDFSTPLAYGPHGSYLTAKPFAASAFGGRLAGSYDLRSGPDSSQAGTSSILELNGNGLDVAQLTHAANPNSSTTVTGSLDLQSKWQGVETGVIQGEGDAQLTGGQLKGVGMLQELSSLLKIKELNEPVLRKLETHFQVAGGVARFTGLQLDAVTFRMTGDGTVGQGGALDANMVLILPVDAMNRIPKEAASSFVQQPDGSGTIGFHVSGTLSQPQTDLPARLLLQNGKIQNVLKKALNHFFH